MNGYYQSFIDKFAQVRSRDELTRTFEMCCGGLKDKHGREIVHGCNKQAFCNQMKCTVYKEYQKWLNIIDDIRKPTVVYVEGSKPVTSHILETRDYKIKPKTQCKQILNIQVAKMLKHDEFDKECLLKIKEHANALRFKRARQLAIKSGFGKIVETVDKFINKGVLGTVKSKNK